MKIFKERMQKMEKRIAGYTAGSIFGRTVYKNSESYSRSSITSIFGTQVYGNKKDGNDGLCQRLLKKFQR